jgi:hypothetical protein
MRALAIAAAMAIVLALPTAAEASRKHPQYLGPAIHDPSIGEWVQGRPRSHGQPALVEYNMRPAIQGPYIGGWKQGYPHLHGQPGLVEYNMGPAIHGPYIGGWKQGYPP